MTAFMQLAPSPDFEDMPTSPSIALQVLNFVIFEAAWFAAVLGAAHHIALIGTLCVIVAIVWHVAVSARPLIELRLVVIVSVIGLVAESIRAWQGDVVYQSGQFSAWSAPYWMVALWGLLAIALNVTMRWMRGRVWLATLVGAIAGPASFISGVRLGAAEFVNTMPALITLVVMWAVLLPLLVKLSMRYDGVTRHLEE